MSGKIDILNFSDKDGAYRRKPSSFRDFISAEPGARFPPEAGRYHLYVSYACPWAHRTLITRHLKGLTSIIGLSVVHWHMDDKGWRFPTEEELKSLHSKDDVSLGTPDHLYGFSRIRELYFKADPDYSGRFTVPVLWDKKEQTIVNNESSEIIRMLNTEFNSILPSEYAELNLVPKDLEKQIDEINGWVYDNINNGVYKTGFASKQEVYDKECKNVFKHLDKVEELLKQNHEKDKKNEFLLGNTLTEADIRLFTTIIRFDPVYVQHFKCNIGMIRSHYPYLHNWLRLLYWHIPGFQETTDFGHIKKHYTKSHTKINPYGITPLGPVPNILPLDA
ncbi:S-glutathionyl-(chloro)hydroquinone reductase [Lodderomyces elongisporus]|uniref:S-glutathionyl-(chloro)hydroquinone reductase n=1 Tax=Lodderomyces elongisporus TaxID=36914 RepID=UPI0029233B24|nr:S-glutathionyl-(chloro)hydroquinone reductase [Lodderomyces elongisporus]WLF76367.1 S-glutathionyl-(chloro)hydroquinone reductase [Lodderomyces elongisporus]